MWERRSHWKYKMHNSQRTNSLSVSAGTFHRVNTVAKISNHFLIPFIPRMHPPAKQLAGT